MREEVNRVDPINILRTIAALCVFFLHTTIFDDSSFFKPDSWNFIFRTPAWGGVWMFIILGGYLAGKSYYLCRYNSTVKDSLRYYWQRLTKTIIPTFAFIFICVVFAFPDFIPNNPQVLIQFITLTYRGSPGVDGIGATWYVFMVAWFYLFTPPVAWLLNKVRLLKHRRVIYAAAFACLALGVGAYRIYSYMNEIVWYDSVYTNAIANADLFFGGFLVAYLHLDALKGESKTVQFMNRNSFKFKVSAIILLIGTILINCYIYNMAHFTEQPYSFIYSDIFPTIYLAVVSLYLIFVDRNICKYEKVTVRSIKKNPLRLIDAFSVITFEFYLFHSLILNKISPYVHVLGRLRTHVLLLFTAGIITLICSIGFHRLFDRPDSKR